MKEDCVNLNMCYKFTIHRLLHIDLPDTIDFMTILRVENYSSNDMVH